MSFILLLYAWRECFLSVWHSCCWWHLLVPSIMAFLFRFAYARRWLDKLTPLWKVALQWTHTFLLNSPFSVKWQEIQRQTNKWNQKWWFIFLSWLWEISEMNLITGPFPSLCGKFRRSKLFKRKPHLLQRTIFLFCITANAINNYAEYDLCGPLIIINSRCYRIIHLGLSSEGGVPCMLVYYYWSNNTDQILHYILVKEKKKSNAFSLVNHLISCASTFEQRRLDQESPSVKVTEVHWNTFSLGSIFQSLYG